MALSASAIFVFSPVFAFAVGCNDDIKPAMQCPSGYTMTCITEGYERWVCAKNVDGVQVPLGSGIPEQKHDTIETSPTGSLKKTPPAKVATSSAQSPKPVTQKPSQAGNAVSDMAHEKKSEGWKEGLPSFLQWIFGGATSTGKKSTTTPAFLSNAYFKNLFKALLGK